MWVKLWSLTDHKNIPGSHFLPCSNIPTCHASLNPPTQALKRELLNISSASTLELYLLSVVLTFLQESYQEEESASKYMYGWVIMRKAVSIVCHLFIFNGSNCAFHPFTTISSRTGGGSHITTILLNYSMFSCQWLTNTDPPPSGWDSVMIKETVRGSYDTHSTWLYSAIGKPNTIIKTMKLSIFWNYLALICTADIPYLPPFYHTTSCCQSISFYDTVIV